MHGHIPTLSRLLQYSAVLALALFLMACRREVPVETITSMAVADDKGVMTIRRSHRVAADSSKKNAGMVNLLFALNPTDC